MILVVDASVALKWFFGARGDEPDVDRALAILEGIGASRVRMLQPPHFLAEMAAVLAAEPAARAPHERPHLRRSGALKSGSMVRCAKASQRKERSMAMPAASRDTSDLSEALKAKARALGANRAGIAPVDRWSDPPPFDTTALCGYSQTGYLPTELLPSARSVVVLAVRQLDGVMDFTTTACETSGPQGNFGYVYLNRRLNEIAFGLGQWLEDQGYRALPLGSVGWVRYDRRTDTDESELSTFYGVFSLKRAAVLAGVGRRARNGLVATPEHGVRVRLGALITSAPLAGDTPLEGDPCPPGCRICMRVCPTDAISTDGRVSHLRCFADAGRRGLRYEDVRDAAKRTYPVDAPGVDYVAVEHLGNEGSGNRQCKVACMALCPLGDRKMSDVVRRVRGFSRVVPKVRMCGFPPEHDFGRG